jgi:hypothetical protein
MIAKHPASDAISEPLAEADLSPRAPGATDSTPGRRYITLLRGVAGVNAALVLAAVVAATSASAPRKLSLLAVRGRLGQRVAAVNAASRWVLHR